MLRESKNESIYHITAKNFVYSTLPKSNIELISLEKRIENRRAEIFIKYLNGKRVAIEVQNSYIRVGDLIQRTKDYNKQGIYVLWILNGEGPCVASKKYPQNIKNVMINSLENYLHKIYYGRVYYINLNLGKKRFKQESHFNIPFSLLYFLSY